MSRYSSIFGLLLAVLFVTPLARASSLTYLINFSATGPGSGDTFSASTAPATVIGSFSITLDPALAYQRETSGIVINALNLPIFPGITPQFSYVPSGSANAAQFIISGPPGVGGVTFGVPGFEFSVDLDPLRFSRFAWSDTGFPGVVVLLDTTGTVTSSSVSAVPEPGTVTLLAAGIAPLLLSRRTAKLRREMEKRKESWPTS